MGRGGQERGFSHAALYGQNPLPSVVLSLTPAHHRQPHVWNPSRVPPRWARPQPHPRQVHAVEMTTFEKHNRLL